MYFLRKSDFYIISHKTFYSGDTYRSPFRFELLGTKHEPLFIKITSFNLHLCSTKGIMLSMNSSLYQHFDHEDTETIRDPNAKPTVSKNYFIKNMLESFGWWYLLNLVNLDYGNPYIKADKSLCLVFDNLDNHINSIRIKEIKEILESKFVKP